jgi:hypothetical protein
MGCLLGMWVGVGSAVVAASVGVYGRPAKNLPHFFATP